MNKRKIKKFSALLIMAIISFIVTINGTYLIPRHPFLIFELKDAFIVTASFIFGPLEGLLMMFTVAFFEMIAVQDSYFGLLMNIVSSCSFVCTAAIIYRKRKNTMGMVISLFAGVTVMTAMMLLWNYTMSPMGMSEVSREEITRWLIPAILPFNLTKSLAGAGLTLLMFNPLNALMVKVGAVKNNSIEKPRAFEPFAFVLSIILLVICTFIILSYREIL